MDHRERTFVYRMRAETVRQNAGHMHYRQVRFFALLYMSENCESAHKY